MREAEMLARAVRDHALHLHEALTPRVRRGIVKQVAPLAVELIDADVVIDADEMLLGAWLRLYDRMYGIAVGDTMFLYPLEDGSWLSFDVASEADMVEGVAPLAQVTASADPLYADPVSGFVTPNRHIIKKVPYLDADGNVVGFIPIFSSLA